MRCRRERPVGAVGRDRLGHQGLSRIGAIGIGILSLHPMISSAERFLMQVVYTDVRGASCGSLDLSSHVFKVSTVLLASLLL